ncbi:MAG: hypothetical protein HY901_18810 [Deltaproteobacteria bacterium]|nr:hypothetical protein [Deltaproteobacteria bacterium]
MSSASRSFTRATPWRLSGSRSSSGTGFAIPGGRILTNAHVIIGAKQVLIKHQGTATPVPADIESSPTTAT